MKIKGRDTIKFLQGLVTNDVQAFHEDADRIALYAFFLNAGGRAMYDVLLYKHGNSVKFPAFLLGCDSQVITDLTNHLKRFQLRSKVDISQGAEYESWLIFSPSGAGARFSKVPRTFRARKAIRKTTTCFFCKAGLFICCKGNKN